MNLKEMSTEKLQRKIDKAITTLSEAGYLHNTQRSQINNAIVKMQEELKNRRVS